MSTTMEAWHVALDSDDFTAPELRRLYLVGRIERDGVQATVATSAIVTAEGRLVTTESGSRYLLGEPSEGYREWLARERPDWDPENPITVGVRS